MNYELPRIEVTVAAALAEDLGVPAEGLLGGTAGPELLDRDVTSTAAVAADTAFAGRIVARSAGVVCGLPVAERVWGVLSEASEGVAVEVFPLVAEGVRVAAGQAVAEIEGDARVVLAGERVALNMLMTLSGIATEARRWQDEAGEEMAVLDTRKTIPGLRELSKYAVRVGGAHNHRSGLWDMVLIKDNHIASAGSIRSAVDAARNLHPELAIEVEADTLEQVEEAALAGADIVLLDNMDDRQVERAVRLVAGLTRDSEETVLCEASGGIVFERLESLRKTGVARVSTSALTLALPLDFGLDEGRA